MTRSRSRSVLWAVACQGISSSTNFALYLVLLFTTSGVAFGRAVALLAVYQLALTVGRPLVLEPMLAGGLGPGRLALEGWQSCRRDLIRIGMVGGTAAAVVGFLVGEDLVSIMAIAIAMPLLLVQDGQRYLAWVLDRPQLSFTTDFVWLLVSACLAVLAYLQFGLSSTNILGLWIVGGLVALVYGRQVVDGRLRRLAVCEAPPKGRADDRSIAVAVDHRLAQLGRNQALNATAFNLLPIVAAVIISPVTAAVMRASLLPYTPMLALAAGLRVVTLPLLNAAADDHNSSAQSKLDAVVARFLNAMVPITVLLVGFTVAAVHLAGSRLHSLEVVTTRSVLWGGVATVMLIVGTQLSDGLGFGRHQSDVVRRRLAAIGLEWTPFLILAALFPADTVMIGWAVGMALSTLIWLMPTFSAPFRSIQTSR